METQPRTLSVHIPVTLLSLAIAVFMASQIGAASRTSETIKWQLSNLDKGMTELKAAEKQLDDLSKQAEPLMVQVKKLQENYTNLFKDVLELAKTDKDAQAVVEKWKIQSNEPAPAPAGGAAPAPAPAPKQP
jgi:peptidoglycan hydrolase CwlO-like protein